MARRGMSMVKWGGGGVPVERGPYPATLQWRNVRETTDNPELFAGWVDDIQAALASMGLGLVTQQTGTGRVVYTAAGHKVAEITTTMSGFKGTVYARPAGGQGHDPGIRGAIAAEELRRSSQWLGYGDRTRPTVEAEEGTSGETGTTRFTTRLPTAPIIPEGAPVLAVDAVVRPAGQLPPVTVTGSPVDGQVTLVVPSLVARTGRALPFFPITHQAYQEAQSRLSSARKQFYGGLALSGLGVAGGILTAVFGNKMATGAKVATGVASGAGGLGGGALAVNGKKQEVPALEIISTYEQQNTEEGQGSSEYAANEEVMDLVPEVDAIHKTANRMVGVAGGNFRTMPAGEVVNGVESLPGDVKITIRDMERGGSVSHFDYDNPERGVYWDNDVSILLSNHAREGQLLINTISKDNGNVAYEVEGQDNFVRKHTKDAPAYINGALLAVDLSQGGTISQFVDPLMSQMNLVYDYALCIGNHRGGAQDAFSQALVNRDSWMEKLLRFSEKALGTAMQIVVSYVGSVASSSFASKVLFTSAMTAVKALQYYTMGNISKLKSLAAEFSAQMGFELFLGYGRDFCVDINEKFRNKLSGELQRETQFYNFVDEFYPLIQSYRAEVGMEQWMQLGEIPTSIGAVDAGLLDRTATSFESQRTKQRQQWEDYIVQYGDTMSAKERNFFEGHMSQIDDGMSKMKNSHDMMVMCNLLGIDNSIYGFTKTLGAGGGTQFDQLRIIMYR